ncbi:MAG: hypothetical protein LBF41_04830 [Deltaproteobacteria bacterium]|nr:hypothetical protein [Deltaproteobacteria bacterium]
MRSLPTSKILLVLAGALLIGSCGGGAKRLNLEFNPVAGTTTVNPGTVKLVVVDDRSDKSLVGPGALAKDLFKGSQNGVVDLEVTLPTGQKIARSVLTAEQAVFEAVKERLNVLGIRADSGGEGAKASVTVSIIRCDVDLVDSEVVARVRLESVVTSPGHPVTSRFWAEADSSRRKLIGDMGGAEALSEALTLAVNRLNFQSLDQY